MKETRYFYVPNASNETELPTEEATHAVRVLRLQAGDEIVLMDGVGAFYKAAVTMASSKHCMYEIQEHLPQDRQWAHHLHLAIAPTKDIGRIEWLVEKATEIGFDEISFLNCKFSERKTLRTDRIERIVVSAMKQSRKAWKPVVNEMVTFSDFIAAHSEGARYICHCYSEIEKTDFFHTLNTNLPTSEEIIVMVGPEGDFSIDEVRLALNKGFLSTSLGTSRLRTETAGLSAVMLMNLCTRK